MTTLFAILAISNPADAISLIGNYSLTNDSGPTTNLYVSSGVATTKAIGLTLPTGSNYTLDNVLLRLKKPVKPQIPDFFWASKDNLQIHKKSRGS